jgi:hypothetical protein
MEIVWSFRPGEAATTSGDDVLSVFGYSVGSWEDKGTYRGDGSAAAAG